MNPLQQATQVLAAAEELNTEVRDTMETITLADAKKIIHTVREVKGWMEGIEKLLNSNGIWA